MATQQATRAAAADFEAFVVSRQRQLQRRAFLLTGDWATAEDLVQTALARTWRRWDRVRGASDPDAYVRRVLVNACVSAGRRRWRGEIATQVLPEVVTSDLADDVVRQQSVWSALGRLSSRQRAVLVLRYVEDLPEAEVAALLGCAVGTVKSTASKALARLREEPSLAGLVEEVQR